MKLSELLAILQREYDAHGDLPILLLPPPESEGTIEKVAVKRDYRGYRGPLLVISGNEAEC